jgi:hypothetical protein
MITIPQHIETHRNSKGEDMNINEQIDELRGVNIIHGPHSSFFFDLFKIIDIIKKDYGGRDD